MAEKRILVTGAGGTAAINFIECLRMSDLSLYIVGTDINRWHLELPRIDSRYIAPKVSDADYLAALQRVIRKERVEFIHAQPDVEVEAVSEHRDELGTRTFLPSKDAIRLCRDKLRTAQRLRAAGVPSPESYLVERIPDIPRILRRLRKDDGPVWLRAVRGAGSRAALPVKTVRQAREWIHYWRTMRSLESRDFMMAEYLPGAEYAFQSVWRDGELVTSGCRARLEYLFGNLSVSGQSSSPSVAMTVHEKGVNEIATRAVLAVDSKANGVFCVDLKKNGAGVPCVTEINAGRFFTTSNFLAKLGANMPEVLVKLAFGEPLPRLPQYDAVPANCYWIRLMDSGPALVRGDTWRSENA